ncbi:glycosyltransferase family 2 protein [Aeromonas caviae]|uniref:glycosyltransferase family 2 protein n=2 Tax=Aeromonas TaxID=642 RepID=UPI0015DC118D|nr:glycosyltransferase [Aeromonas caviae]BBT22110.1 hypothetical protein WP8S17E03_25350 [Aeromonas caviae]
MFTKLIAPHSEAEIKKHWKYTDNVYISVLCPCFNQENYIRDAIESFLAQECEYSFEIIVHDDASTDSTPEILKAYQARFPTIIKLVLQTENQYSQGKQISAIAASHAQGEYLALCEGDDFWIDNKKIQKQMDVLNVNQQYNICITKAIALYPDNTTVFFCDLGNAIRYLSFDFCIEGPKKDFFPTASFFIRKKIFENLPEWFFTDAPVGDYYLQICAAESNGCIYLPYPTTIYRRDSLGSWMSNRRKSDLFMEAKRRISTSFKIKEMLAMKHHKTLARRLGNNYLPLYCRNFFEVNYSEVDISIIIKVIVQYPTSIYWFVRYLIIRIFNKRLW